MASLLTDEERNALAQNIQQSARAKPRTAESPPPVPVALIADDQASEKVRPSALRLATRWAALLRRSIPPASGAKVTIDVSGAEAIEAKEAAEEVAACWLGMARPVRRRGSVLVAVSGPMIPVLAARMLGGDYDAPPDKPPTAATLRVFSKVGDQIVAGLAKALQNEQGCDVVCGPAPASAEVWAPIADDSSLVLARLEVGGEAQGIIRLVSPPETLMTRRRAARTVVPAPEIVNQVLGEVPVELSVELGRARMRAGEFAALEPGAVLSLDTLVGEALPVRVAGKLKAMGNAVLAGEVLAVEIEIPRRVGKRPGGKEERAA